ncbi:DUF692 domain-containing protein [Hylemonella sp. W303a]|uniref:MNIO family bufferin maturase n=1 Tax=Hylemonella sp. W303a TaxID=3389873 RepID=UPI00396B30C2
MANSSMLGAGLGLKPQHYEEARDADDPGLWFEVHPENYLMEGGPRLAWLQAVGERHPLSLHGVSLSLAADTPPDPAQLARLARLAARVQPALVSEHLAWSTWNGHYHPDLLPFPRTQAALQRIASNISLVQDALGRRIAVENPAHYLRIEGHEWGETDFLAELTRRTGCGLLLDLNNVLVGAHNLGYDAQAYLDNFPTHAVMEIHLAGHRLDEAHAENSVAGRAEVTRNPLLIDSHDSPVAEPVWALYDRLIARTGPRPTLIERDDNIPPFAELLREARHAAARMSGLSKASHPTLKELVA